MAGNATRAAYIPQCADVSPNSFSLAEAQRFDLNSYQDYYETLWPTVVPGIVLGSLAALGFVFFLIWICVQCYRRRQGAGTKLLLDEDGGATAELQFISGAEYHSQYFQPPPSRIKRTVTAGRALKACITLLTLALVGVVAWGLAASIQETNDTVPSFWEVVDAADAKVANASSTLQQLSSQMAQLSTALGVLSTQATRASQVLAGLGISQVDIDLLGSTPAGVRAELQGLQGDVANGIQLLQSKGNQTIQDLRQDLYSVTQDVSETWRFIPIAVVFGLTILFAVAAGVLVVCMRWPKTASLSTALLWLAVLALMFLGVGLMRGVYEVGQDSCLYLEPFALRYASDHVSDAGADRQRVLAALEYYFGYRDIPDDQVAEVLVGAPTRELHAALQSAQVRSVLSMIDPSGQDLVRKVAALVSVPQQDQAAVLGILDLVPALDSSVTSLEQQLQRPNVEPVYRQAKEWVCCKASGAAWSVWVAWTVAGCVGWVLCALCSARVMLHTLGVRRAQRRFDAARPAAGLPPTNPYVGDSPGSSEYRYHGDAAVVVSAAAAQPAPPVPQPPQPAPVSPVPPPGPPMPPPAPSTPPGSVVQLASPPRAQGAQPLHTQAQRGPPPLPLPPSRPPPQTQLAELRLAQPVS